VVRVCIELYCGVIGVTVVVVVMFCVECGVVLMLVCLGESYHLVHGCLFALVCLVSVEVYKYYIVVWEAEVGVVLVCCVLGESVYRIHLTGIALFLLGIVSSQSEPRYFGGLSLSCCLSQARSLDRFVCLSYSLVHLVSRGHERWYWSVVWLLCVCLMCVGGID